MGTTSFRKLPWPETTDSVAAGAAAIRALAEAMDAQYTRHNSVIPTGCAIPSTGGTLGFAPVLTVAAQIYPQIGWLYLAGQVTIGSGSLAIRDSSNTILAMGSVSGPSQTCRCQIPIRLAANVSATYNAVATATVAFTVSSDSRWARFAATFHPGA